MTNFEIADTDMKFFEKSRTRTRGGHACPPISGSLYKKVLYEKPQVEILPWFVRLLNELIDKQWSFNEEIQSMVFKTSIYQENEKIEDLT